MLSAVLRPVPGRSLTRVWAIAASVALTHCAAIDSFHAEPRNICPGSTVTVSWQASGQIELTSTPPVLPAGTRPSTGSEQLVLEHSTRFVLHALGFLSERTAEADVTVLENESRNFGGSANCEKPEHGVTRAVSPPVSAALRVASVTNVNSRPIVLQRQDVRVTLQPGDTTTVFAGLTADGLWEIEAPLVSDELCDDALAALHDRLFFRITFACVS